jgi:hypothetical protein
VSEQGNKSIHDYSDAEILDGFRKVAAMTEQRQSPWEVCETMPHNVIAENCSNKWASTNENEMCFRCQMEQSLIGLARRLMASRAHTYASENADHYRGFDAGQQRAAELLGVPADRLRG